MTILDSLRSSNELKSNPELSKLLSLKPTMKQKRTQEKKLTKNINWFADQLKSYKTKTPTGVNYQIDLKWKKPSEHETVVSSDFKSVCFHSDCTSCFETNAIRTDQPLKRNSLTYWEVTLMNKTLSGTSLMIGVGTSKARTISNGYVNLLGVDEHSWGLAHTGQAWHANKSTQFCVAFEESSPITIGCLFNGYTGTLTYFKNGVSLGVAFTNFSDTREQLYPMVSSTASQSVFKLDAAFQSMPSLQEISSQVVLKHNLDYSDLPLTIVNQLKKL